MEAIDRDEDVSGASAGESEDVALVRAYCAGSATARRTVGCAVMEACTRAALTFTSLRPADRAEAVSRAALHVIEKIALFDGRSRSRLSTWIHRVAVNAILDMTRAARFRGVGQTGEEHLGLEIEESDHGDALVIERDRALAIRRVLADEFDAGTLAVIERVYGEDASMREIANDLGIREGAARLRMHRVRERLREVPVLRELAEAG